MHEKQMQVVAEHHGRARCLIDPAGTVHFERGEVKVAIAPQPKFAEFILKIRAAEKPSMFLTGLFAPPEPSEDAHFVAVFYVGDSIRGAYCSQSLDAELVKALLFQWPALPVVFFQDTTAEIKRS